MTTYKLSYINGVIVSADQVLCERIRGFWPESEANWQVYDKGGDALQRVLNSLPSILITSLHLPDLDGFQISALLKAENVYNQLPILVCLDHGDLEAQDELEESQADDFYVLPGDDEEFKRRIRLTVLRASRNLDANPLSHLPGNTSIIRYIQERIDRKEDFAMCYCDLDYFKSFNDRYGFIRGDEVLMMSARIVLNTVRNISPEGYFVGHIGGDDFVFVLSANKAEEACRQIIKAFDAIVPQFYDKEDRERRGIVTPDRHGVIRTFPIMALSIAVVCNTNGRLQHVGQASAISISLKKKAKASIASSYIIDRRSNCDIS